MKKLLLLTLFTGIMYSQEKTMEISEELRNEIKKEIKAELELKDKKTVKNIKESLFDRVKISGRATLRLGELDWAQKRISADGTRFEDSDRYWSRYNFYLSTDAKLTKEFSTHATIRTGHKQYSFVNFGGNTDERFNIILDQVWLDWKKGNYKVRIGRQSIGGIWKNQKGSQFDVPRHDGVSVAANYKVSEGITVKPQVGFFNEYYRNNTGIKDQGKIYGASVSASQNNESNSWMIQVGNILSERLPNRYSNDLAQVNTDEGGTRYHDGDLAERYHILTSHLEATFKDLKNLSFQLDLFKNIKDYDENPQSNLIKDINGNSNLEDLYDGDSAPDFTNQNNGFIATASLGSQSKVKSFYGGISYLYLEKYAAMDYFAQYDYARWASTNIKGPEFTAAYRLNKFMKIRGRLFLPEEIKGLQAIDEEYTRSGNRFRLDININF